MELHLRGKTGMTPVGRFAQAREIGYLVAFLVSDKDINLRGTTIDATSGMLR